MSDFREKLIWKKCEYVGCERSAGGDCGYCGFHPGELSLHDIDTAQRIVDKYTVQNEGEDHA